jgi:lipoprotein-anchoring transpeptidase ErfK/SrfK
MLRHWHARIATVLLLFAPTTGASPAGPARTDPTRVVISLADRMLWVIQGGDTLLVAPVAVGSTRTLRQGGRSWTFSTPRGDATVIAKETDPLWIPPDWHYVELARKHGLALAQLKRGQLVRLWDGSHLTVRGDIVGVVAPDSTFGELPRDEEIIFDGVLYAPPFGTRNRRIEGVLGPYRLRLSNGIGLHGTPYKETIGEAATHGCIRLYDDDIAWLYEHIPVGTRVHIY